MIMKIRKFFSNLRVFKRIKVLMGSVERLRKSNFDLKGLLMDKRKVITGLKEAVLKGVNDLNLLEGKKQRASKLIAELIKRRDEFLKRIKVAVPDASITTFADYKFWLSESFIVESYEDYVENTKDDIDRFSAMKGLNKIFEEIDEKIDTTEEFSLRKKDKKVDDFTTP